MADPAELTLPEAADHFVIRESLDGYVRSEDRRDAGGQTAPFTLVVVRPGGPTPPAADLVDRSNSLVGRLVVTAPSFAHS
jgi:hypothetical protein